MNVVYFGSQEIKNDFRTAINSLLAHTNANVFAVVEEELELPVTNIRWENKWFNDLNTQTKWKSFGCIRPALTKLFPDVDTILSIDVDTIVEQDISELFDIDLAGYYFAAVKEPYLSTVKPYFNTGVCLMNLKLLRETGKDEEMINALNTVRFRYVSQDCMNTFCEGKILELPPKYNVCKFIPSASCKIRHYADEVYWRGLPEVKRWDV